MSKKRKVLITLLVILLFGFFLPEDRTMPVKGASINDWNANSFWYEPWGTSGVHKGIDIFSKSGTPVLTSTNQWILYRGEISKGGKVILALGPGWRFHYYAHLKDINLNASLFIKSGTEIGSVGDTGNAKGKQPHLHYSIVSLFPLLWEIDSSTQGYKKAFYINPGSYAGR